jgi:hypothetical protein
MTAFLWTILIVHGLGLVANCLNDDGEPSTRVAVAICSVLTFWAAAHLFW